jgi:ATPase family associated with various cellular activities (AAA)/Winged helix domain, variant
MSDAERWQKNNDAYLAAALHWLRLRVARQAGPEPEAAGKAATPTPTSASLMQRIFGGAPATPSVAGPPLLTAGTSTATDLEITQAAEAMAAAEKVEPPPALMILSQRFGLSRFEKELLLQCAAMEWDTRLAGLCSRAQDDPNRRHPTFALALALFDEPVWEALSPERPLRYWRLLEINQPGAQPLTTSALRADERVVNYLKGLNYLDDRLASLLAPLQLSGDHAELPPSQEAAVAAITHGLKQADPAQRLPIIQLLGPDTSSKQLIASQAAATLGLQLYRLPAESLPSQAAELENLARLWQRESLLLPVALYLDAHEAEKATTSESSAAQGSLNRFLMRSSGLIFLDTREVWPGLGQATLALDIAKPTPAEQQAAWTKVLGSSVGDGPALLASQFNLSLAAIQQIAQRTLNDAASNVDTIHDRLWEACLASTRPRLDTLAQRLDPKATWDDIVLPAGELSLLRQIASQVRQRGTVYENWGFGRKMNRGLGISALFAGESGTGKTMAAEVIANDLRLNLYRIDLSAVVSKYIGETEKNLRKLFDAAEDGGAILFFDEADALFGKRSEVKDSHDRYANIEINYLLQRMEAYRGLAILATNMKSALDTAFTRRLRFIVNFTFPGAVERKQIWQKVFPEEAPVNGLDYDRLARFNLTGGGIHNIALNAAFLAATQQPLQVTMPLVLAAARTEFRKMERPVNEADFR